MERIAGYTDEKLLREHDVIMERIILSNATTSPVSLERGSVIGVNADGLNMLFATGMTSAAGVLAETVTVPAKSSSTAGKAFGAIYVHANFVADQLKFASDVTDDDKQVALTSLKTLGCYAS